MELSKCLGCMEDLQGYPCPNCGYDPVKEKRPEYALPPESILAGKYLVGKVLGQGGFGITYIGWDLALERKVAIKEYYPSGQVSRSPGTRSLTWYTNEPAIQAREDGMGMFLKEARKMVKADSIPGVVRVLDLFQENGTAYIVMDFVSGETLKTRLQKTGPMAWTQAAPIFRPAIRAMEQVHQAGLIHRDLSPDNLMLTPNGDVKILDLGAAKDLNLNSGASSMQVAKSGFSPLEQYTQRGGSGPWTDVYSMAATIYYTLTGKLPPNAIEQCRDLFEDLCTQKELEKMAERIYAAGKLVGVFVYPLPRLGNANQLQQLNGPVPGGLFVQALVELQGLRNLVSNGKYRVQGGHGLLENHGDPVAPELPHFLFGQGQKVLAVKDDAAALVPAGGRVHQTHDRQAGDAFAAAGFTHNAQCLSLVQGKGDAVHRLGNTGIGVEIGFQVFYFQQTHGTPPYPMWISYGVWDRFSMPDWVTSTSSSRRTPQSPGK